MRITKIQVFFSAFFVFSDTILHFSNKLADYREFLRIAHYYATESMLVWNSERINTLTKIHQSSDKICLLIFMSTH